MGSWCCCYSDALVVDGLKIWRPKVFVYFGRFSSDTPRQLAGDLLWGLARGDNAGPTLPADTLKSIKDLGGVIGERAMSLMAVDSEPAPSI